MKSFYLIIPFLLSIVCLFSCKQKIGRAIDLDKLWKIKLGDSIAYSKISFNDDQWDKVTVDEILDKQGYNKYDGVFWFRYKVIIPSSFKKIKNIKKIQFNFGIINDCDQFYLNGIFVGSDNKMGDTSLNNSISFANTNRVYDLPIEDNRILWDKENVIAIRVLDLEGSAGMNTSAFINASEFDIVTPLKNDWKFTTADSMIFANESYNDSHWANIRANQYWESQGYQHDGFAWYRMHLKIPSDLKHTRNKIKDSLQFFLGKIDDNDQVFLNGFLIGENNKNITKLDVPINDDFKDHGKFYDVNRLYSLSLNDNRIKWDKNNLLVIRVFDAVGRGGLNESFPFIKVPTVQDDIVIDHSKFYRFNKENELDTILIIYNKNISKPFNGSFKCTVEVVDTNELVGEQNFNVSINPLDSCKINLLLPRSFNRVRLTLTVVDSAKMLIYMHKYIIPFILI